MAKLDLIIFDCDGVLIDSEGIALQVLCSALKDYGVELSLAEAKERYVGRSEASEVADIKSRYNLELPPSYFEKKQRLRMKMFEDSLRPIEGIAALIDGLSFKKCVASGSSLDRLHHSLGLVGLWSKFAPHIFSATQVKHGKPAPDLFLYAAAQMGVSPSSCLVIEDSVAGVQAAKAAGMKVLGFTGGSHCDIGHGDVLCREGAVASYAHMSDLAKNLSFASP